MPLEPPHPPETRQFNAEIQFLLKPENPHARSLLAFIRRTIRQFKLGDHITEIDIFIEAYLRGVKYTQTMGATIQHPKAWMRSTAYFIIRECHRERSRYLRVASDELLDHYLMRNCLSDLMADQLVGEAFIEAEIAAVIQAMSRLDPLERRIIELKHIDGLSWKEVLQQLILENHPPLRGDALRKRGQRALQRLRQLYHEIRPPQVNDRSDLNR